MRILYLIHQFYPECFTGTEKIFLNVVTMAQKYGHRVKVMTYSSYEDSSYDQRVGNILFRHFLYKGIEVVALKHKETPPDVHYSLEDKDLGEVARELISREKPDVVHVAHPMRVGELVKILRPLNLPYVVTLTDFFLMCPKYTLLTSRNTLCSGPKAGAACQSLCPELGDDLITSRLKTARSILFGAQAVVSLSKFMASIFEQEFTGLPIKVINPGLRYSVLKKTRWIDKKGEGLTFCYAGSFNFHKGVHVLIEAFKDVRSEKSPLKIYGSGTDKSYVERLMAMAGEDQRIEFCGVYSEDQVGEILAQTDVIVTPSLWYETYCLILHEALACNVPVVASDVGVMAEQIKHSVNGFLFPAGDADQLRGVLQHIADDPRILNRLRQNINSMTAPTVEQEAYAYDRIYAGIMAGV